MTRGWRRWFYRSQTLEKMRLIVTRLSLRIRALSMYATLVNETETGTWLTADEETVLHKIEDRILAHVSFPMIWYMCVVFRMCVCVCVCVCAVLESERKILGTAKTKDIKVG